MNIRIEDCQFCIKKYWYWNEFPRSYDFLYLLYTVQFSEHPILSHHKCTSHKKESIS